MLHEPIVRLECQIVKTGIQEFYARNILARRERPTARGGVAESSRRQRLRVMHLDSARDKRDGDDGRKD